MGMERKRRSVKKYVKKYVNKRNMLNEHLTLIPVFWTILYKETELDKIKTIAGCRAVNFEEKVRKDNKTSLDGMLGQWNASTKKKMKKVIGI